MVAAAIVGSVVVGAAVGIKGAKEGAAAQVEAAGLGAEAQRAAREAFEARTQPFADIGLGAGEQLQEFLAAPQQDTTQRLQSFLDDPTQQLAEINPIVDFLRQQGFEQIQESAAAQGRLGAGGTLRDLTRFDVGLTSTIVPQLQAQRFNQLTSFAQQQNQLQNQRFNQLFNVTGLGANVVTGQGTAGLQTAANIANLQVGAGQAQAAGIQGQTQAITGGIQNLAATAGAFPNLFSPPPTAIQATPAEIAGALTGGV